MQANGQNTLVSSGDGDITGSASTPTSTPRRRIFSYEELDQTSSVGSNNQSAKEQNTTTQASKPDDEVSTKRRSAWLLKDSKMEQKWKKGIEKKKVAEKEYANSGKSYDSRSNSVKISRATRHEHEVEAIIRHVMQQEAENKSEEQATLRKTSSQSSRTQMETGPGDIEGQQPNDEDTQLFNSPGIPRTPNQSLSYLITLQQCGEEESNHDSSIEPSQNVDSNQLAKGNDLLERGSLERILSMSSAFRAAAKLNSHRSQQSAGEPREETTSQRNVNSEHEIVFDVDEPDEKNADVMRAQPSSSGGLDVEAAGANGENGNPPGGFSGFSSKIRHGLKSAFRSTAQEWSSLNDFFRPKRATLRQETRFFLFTIMLPSFALALFLFYVFGNPPTGRCKRDSHKACSSDSASASWWILFIGCRHVLVWILAKISDIFLIDFLVLQHPRVVKMLGPGLSLLLVQSKGWPSQICWWGVWSILVLFGKGAFKRHWFFWQDFFGLFNDENPSGNVSSSKNFSNLIIASFVVSVSVCLKRNIVGLHLGARLYERYNERLKITLREVLLVSELSMWARRKRDEHKTYDPEKQKAALREDSHGFANVVGTVLHAKESSRNPSESVSKYESNFVTLSAFLEPWDEPNRSEGESITGKQIIEFHQGVAVITRPYFFSSAFGPVETREECIRSSEVLFRRILKLMGNRGEESICLDDLTMWMLKGCQTEEDQDTAEELCSLFQPDKEGNVYIIDFITAIDEIYKKLRTLQHAVKNASDVSKSYERVINFLFYFCVGCAVLAILDLSPLSLIIPLAFVLIAFGFMIGPGTSILFDGVLLILVRQPYDVGDKVAINDIYDSPIEDGSTWRIESIDLVKTTARLVGTAEVASFSNGSLAQSRIINMNRSNGAIVCVHVQFTLDVPYSTVKIFRAAVEKFVEDHPQEWAEMMGFKTKRVEMDSNLVEYSIVLKHQCTWQDMSMIHESKTQLESFCIEAQKHLDCQYEGPPLAVEVTLVNQKPNDKTTKDWPDKEESMEKLITIANEISPISSTKKDN